MCWTIWSQSALTSYFFNSPETPTIKDDEFLDSQWTVVRINKEDYEGVLFLPFVKSPFQEEFWKPILWCHGNREYINTTFCDEIQQLTQRRFNFVEYCGYGCLNTTPFFVDIAIQTMLHTLNFIQWDIVVGYSLGGILMSQAMGQHDQPQKRPRRLILINSAFSFVQVLESHIGSQTTRLLPQVTSFQKDWFSSAKINPKETYLVHALDDAVIPFQIAHQSSQLYGCNLVVLPNGGHSLAPWKHLALWKHLLF